MICLICWRKPTSYASDSNNRKITHLHINKALEAKAERTNRVSQAILKEMIEGSVLIDTDGEAIGKINGLTVLSIGDTSFGSPARITAAVYPRLPRHRRYRTGSPAGTGDSLQGGDDPHRLSRLHLCPEVPAGDLRQHWRWSSPTVISTVIAPRWRNCAVLLSALTNVPIKQSFAITGSMNQHGEVQAIGGVNEKVECFFDLYCEARGLTGDQGVIIPAANVRNLMLNEKVLNAVKQGKFAVYAVSHVEEALEILTGFKRGALNSKGKYPQNSLNERVMKRLDGDRRSLQRRPVKTAESRQKQKSLDPHSHRGSLLSLP